MASQGGIEGSISIKNAEKVLGRWNVTPIESARDGFVPGLQSAPSERTPDAPAVADESGTLTYRELNSRSNQLAHHLRLLDVGPEVLVGLCLGRLLNFVVAALGVMKAGGAYLPIDPATPKARTASVLTASQVSVVITEQAMTEGLPAGNWSVL